MAVASLPICLQCAIPSRRPGALVCSRCGLRIGDPPRADAALPACPICYREVDPDGLLPAASLPFRRVALPTHLEDHERAPVGDDDWLETLREGDRVRVGRWKAPFDLVRRYLVTGVVSAGRSRAAHHDSIVTAMTQIARWGRDAAVLGDQPEWAEARAAVGILIERYHRRGP